MAVVTAEIRFAPKNAAWFTTNAALVLADGEIVYRSTDGKYIIGDGTTAVSGLTFYGGVSSSGLTIGTTTITGGTNTRILYNNSGVVGEYSVTGSGTTAVLSTSPTFTTDIKTPIVYGSTSASGTLTLGSTSNVTKGTIQIGSTDLVNIGNAVTTNQRLVRIGQDTAYVDIGSLAVGTSNSAIYFNQSAPGLANAALWGSASSTSLNVAASGDIGVKFGNVALVTMYGTMTGGNITNFTLTLPAMNTVTASANSPSVKVTGSTKTWAAGALATQYFNYFSANTVAFASASTATHVANFRVDAPVQGTNATATNLYAIDCGGHLFVANSAGVPSNNPTGGGILYVESGALKYRGSSGTVTTIANA